jgi:isoquinoline 1-oxidoreductase beta subunit
MRTTRRQFLRTSALGSAGLAIWLEMPQTVAGQAAPVFEPSAYIRITPDNIVRLWITRSEMGQGVRTTLPMMLNEELEADWAQVRCEQALPGGRFKGIRLRTSGSGSTVGTYAALRKAGATAREMLIAAAAGKWNVEPSACRAQQGEVIHILSGRKSSYGELAEAAARQTVPANPPLKDPRDFRVIGKRRKRTDGAPIVTGQAVFGLDVRVPGMLYAVMERCPFFGGKVAHLDTGKALAISDR